MDECCCQQPLPLGYEAFQYRFFGFSLFLPQNTTTVYLRRRVRQTILAYNVPPFNCTQDVWTENTTEVSKYQKWSGFFTDARADVPKIITNSDSGPAPLACLQAPQATALDPIIQIEPHHWRQVGWTTIGGARVDRSYNDFYGELPWTRDEALALMRSTLDSIPFADHAVHGFSNDGLVLNLGISAGQFAREPLAGPNGIPPPVVCVGTIQHLRFGSVGDRDAAICDVLSMAKERLQLDPGWCDVSLRATLPQSRPPEAQITEVLRCSQGIDSRIVDIVAPPEMPPPTEIEAVDQLATLRFLLRPTELPWAGVARPQCCNPAP